MTYVKIGALADAEYIASIRGEIATLRGVIVSVAEPHSRFNARDERTASVVAPDGSIRTSSSTMPVRIVAEAGSPEARRAVSELLASGARLSERARKALEVVK